MKTTKYLPYLAMAAAGAYLLLHHSNAAQTPLDPNMPALMFNNWTMLMQNERNPDLLNAAAATFDLGGFHLSAQALRSKAASIPVVAH